jgi:hypothetical protein
MKQNVQEGGPSRSSFVQEYDGHRDDISDDGNNTTIMERETVARLHNKTFDTVEYSEYATHSSPEPEIKRQALEVDVLSNFSASPKINAEQTLIMRAQDDANNSARMNSNLDKITTNAIEIVEQITSMNNNTSELERIQRECVSMVETIKTLHAEERQLREANNFLAYRAVVMGCTAGLDGGTRRGARRKAAAKKAASTAP